MKTLTILLALTATPALAHDAYSDIEYPIRVRMMNMAPIKMPEQWQCVSIAGYRCEDSKLCGWYACKERSDR